MKITVYMMHGYHWDIPGTINRPFVTKEEAVNAAASLVNLLRVDCQDLYEDEDDVLEPATADNWEEILRGVRRLRSECNVEISPVEMEVPVNWVYADRLYDALMENHEAWHGEEDSVKDEHAELIKNNSDLIIEIAAVQP